MIDTIFIMPNKETNPDATLMIVVDEKDPSTDPKTYQYVYVGNINDLPSDVLTENSIVNDLSTGGTDKPLSAEQGRTLNSHVNYVTRGSGDSDQIKLIPDDGFELSTHLRLLVMMTNTNTHATPKFNINNTGVKDVWYNGSVASDTNTWAAGEVLDVYYDGTRYIATTYGGAQFSTGEKVGDVGIDAEPIAGSDNLVKSGGVQENLDNLNKSLGDRITELSGGEIIEEIDLGTQKTGKYYNSSNNIVTLVEFPGFIYYDPIDISGNAGKKLVIKIVGSTNNTALIGVTNSSDQYLFVKNGAYFVNNQTAEFTLGAGSKKLYISYGDAVTSVSFKIVDEVTGRVTVLETEMPNKVDKETGKGLSSNDFIDADKDVIEGTKINVIELLGTELSGKYYDTLLREQTFETGRYYSPIDLTQYAGKKLKIVISNYSSGSGAAMGFGTTGTPIQGCVRAELHPTSVDGTTGIYEITIPSTGNFYMSYLSGSTKHLDSITIQETDNLTTRLNVIEDELRGLTGKSVYMATNGSDENDGSKAHPFATLAFALSKGNNVIVRGGVYSSGIDIDTLDNKKVTIIGYPGEKVDFKFGITILNDGSEELVDGYTKVYRIAMASSPYPTLTDAWLWQDGVGQYEISLSERHPLYRGKQYRMDSTRIKQKTSIADIEALTDGEYGWFYDNGYLYFSRPTQSSTSHPIIAPVKDEHCINSTSEEATISIFNINVYYANINVENGCGHRFVDVAVRYPIGGCFYLTDAIGVIMERVEACGCTTGSSAGGDGIGIHTDNVVSPDEIHSTTRIIDAWCHDTNDDGFSDHYSSETVIDGGLFEHCGKGCITPSWGANDVIRNAIARYAEGASHTNSNGNGIYVVGGTPTSNHGRIGTNVEVHNCYISNCTNGFKVETYPANVVCYDCNVNDCTNGYVALNGNENCILTIVDCSKSGTVSTPKYGNVIVKQVTKIS